MAKITVNKKGQARITVPVEIMQLKGWNEKVEVIFIPYIQEPKSMFDKDTPILIKEIGKIKVGK